MALIVKVQLVGIKKPPVWRRIALSTEATFYDLHNAIQSAFHWTDTHLWSFYGGRGTGWEVREADEWSRFDHPDGSPDQKILSWVWQPKFYYVYDFGDYWEHSIEILDADDRKMEPGEFEILAVKGENPREDMGGVDGFLLRRAIGPEKFEEYMEKLYYGEDEDEDEDE